MGMKVRNLKNSRRCSADVMEYTAIDLFSGCGGLSVGLEQVGFSVLAGVDFNEPALKTFAANHPEALTLSLDLSDPTSLDVLESQLGEDCDVDLVAGGPPCQGFSLTGPRRLDDPRNELYMSVLRAAERFQPKALLIENVRGMATLYNGEVLADVVESIERLGYVVTPPQVLDAASFGVPQHRLRLFIVATRRDVSPFSFPLPTHGPDQAMPYLTCSEAISDLPSLEHDLGCEEAKYEATPQSPYQRAMREGSAQLLNHVGTRHTEHVKEVIAQVPEGGNHKDLPPGVGESRKFNEAWTRYHSQRPSRTIDTGHRNHFHYRWNRVPTIRENARLQSFPDAFRFLGTKTQQNRQVGNAVPPLLAAALGRNLLACFQNQGD